MKRPATRRLAKKALRIYRLYRRLGYTPRLAATHAHFSITVMRYGRTNLYAFNRVRGYDRYWYPGGR